MKVMVLDDDETRHKIFAQYYRDSTVYCPTWNTTQAKAALLGTVWDVVYLDHSLGEYYNPDQERPEIIRERTGEHVVDWMCQELPEDRKPGLVIIHSHDVYPSERMASKLRQAGYKVQLNRFDPKAFINE